MRRLQWLAVACLTLAAAGCAAETSPVAPPVLDVSGTWLGTWEFVPASAGSGILEMTLTQDGARVSGGLRVSGPTLHRPTALHGVVVGERIEVAGPAGEGWLTVNGDDMSGELNGFLPVKLIARRQR
jgi:hypothetical protein